MDIDMTKPTLIAQAVASLYGYRRPELEAAWWPWFYPDGDFYGLELTIQNSVLDPPLRRGTYTGG